MANLVSRPNRCIVEDVDAVLTKKKKFKELIEFYKVRKLHRRALEKLYLFATSRSNDGSSEQDLQGFEPTIEYLKELNADNIELILEFSTAVIRRSPEQALDVACYPCVCCPHVSLSLSCKL